MGSLSLQQAEGDRHVRTIWLGLALILSVMTVSASSETEHGKASVQELRAKLFANYDKLIRPVVDQKTVVPLHLGMAPIAITHLDEEKQVLEMDSWLLMQWKDEFLVWNPEEYNGIQSFNIPSTEIWRPDITVYSGTPAGKIVIDVLTNAIVNYTGYVLWVPPVDIRSRCPQENYGGYPQDTRTCVVRFGSWTYNEYLLDIQNLYDVVKTADFKNINPEWELVSVTTERESKTYPCCKEPYPHIDYKFNLRRRSSSRSCGRCGSGRHNSHVSQHRSHSSSDSGCH